jgi:hypothetical protein
MLPLQTSQVLLGAVAAFFYAGAVIAIGMIAVQAAIGRRLVTVICDRIGILGLVWLCFVTGQGVTGSAWSILSLGGFFYPLPVWILVLLGWMCGWLIVLRHKYHLVQSCRSAWNSFLSFVSGQSWYLWVGICVLTLVFLRGLIALLPPSIDDALHWYLTTAKVIATTHTQELMPFLHPYYGLLPLQIEMHWAALFAISNETAVTVWDYLCATSFLAGIGFFAWALTDSRRVAIIAIVMMFTSSAYYEFMGGGKTDNAAAQYGIAAFLWLLLLPALGSRSILLAGLCIGWAIAGRYSNSVLVPAVMIFTVIAVYRASSVSYENRVGPHVRKSWLTIVVIGCIAIGLPVAPTLIRNWLDLGCPVAPIVGCDDTFLASARWLRGVSAIHNQFTRSFLDRAHDLRSLPLEWSFAYGHRANTLGNISPLFLGLLPFLLFYNRSPVVRSGLIAGLAGFISIIAWWSLFRTFPNARWLLVPFGLLAVYLSSAAIAAERDPRLTLSARWSMRVAIVTLLFFLLFQSRSVVYAARYLTSIDTRHSRYEGTPVYGYDVATWLNTHIQPGQRVALAGWRGYPYFVDPDHLWNSESATELQWLWQFCRCRTPKSWTQDFWRFYAERGFTYAITAKERLPQALTVLPTNLRVEVAFVGQKDAVLRLNSIGYH